MNAKTFSDAMSCLDDRYVEEALRYTKKRTAWVRRAAIAACVCVLAGVALLLAPRRADAADADLNRLLSAVAARRNTDTAGISTLVPVGDRIAVYAAVYAADGGPSDGTWNEVVKSMAQCRGEPYLENCAQVRSLVDGLTSQTCSWYYPKGSGNLKYLIREDADGVLTLWLFRSFVVDERVLPEDMDEAEKAELRQELEALSAAYESIFPGTDRSPYTCGEVYSRIYGITGADDIERITAQPSNANNTELGKRIQSEIGTHDYTDRADIEAFYAATKDLRCWGEDGWEGYYSMYRRFSYSFSTDSTDMLSSGELTRGSRYLTLTLKDGTTIDSLKYDAIRGCIYEFYGIISEPMPEGDVLRLNAIFGIR